jgi:large subunit ribosomal protein L19
MTTKLETFIQPYLKKDLPDIRPGDTIQVYQKIKEKKKEKIQIFEGLVIARKHGKEIGATITVRKVIGGIGVEKIFPIHSKTIEKIEVLKKGKVRRAKLYYLRKAKGRKARLKKKSIVQTQEFVKPEIEKKSVKKKPDTPNTTTMEKSKVENEKDKSITKTKKEDKKEKEVISEEKTK